MPTKSFEDRLARLEQVAESLKDGKIPLEEAIALFEEGSKLAKTLEKELSRVERKVQVLSGEEAETGEPALIRAGLAHLWFVTLHPFDDGNGRIARAVGDLFLARADRSPQRFYSLSAQIQRDRKDYYDVLERTQKGTLDVTGWLSWFLGTLGRAVTSAQTTLDAVLVKARFWQRWAGTPLNEAISAAGRPRPRLGKQ